jgi:hypothetical protein
MRRVECAGNTALRDDCAEWWRTRFRKRTQDNLTVVIHKNEVQELRPNRNDESDSKARNQAFIRPPSTIFNQPSLWKSRVWSTVPRRLDKPCTQSSRTRRQHPALNASEAVPSIQLPASIAVPTGGSGSSCCRCGSDHPRRSGRSDHGWRLVDRLGPPDVRDGHRRQG